MNNILILFLTIFLNKYVYCDREGFFTVVGSNVIKVDKPYRVSVAYQGYSQEKVLQIGIEKYVNKQESDLYKLLQNVSLKGDGVQDFDFNIKNQSAGSYKLMVKSKAGNLKKSFAVIQSIMKKCSILIQTDKSIYKPSDTVKFRVIVIDEDTKPYKFEKVEIYITDGANNRVKQFETSVQNFKSGVHQNEFLLSDSPVLGSWEIHVKVDDEEHKVKTFDVGEYVLPTFEVILDAYPVVNLKDDIIHAEIDAKYTFGRIAKGNAAITAWLYTRYNSVTRTKTNEIIRSIKIDGKKSIEFSLKDDFGINLESFQTRTINVYLNVTFVDELSRMKGSARTDVEVYKTPYNVKLQIDPPHFKPKEMISVTVDVRLHDRNIPVTDKYNQVLLIVEYYYRLSQEVHPENGTFVIMQENYKYYSKDIEAKLINGRAYFDVKTDENLIYIRLEAQYLDNEAHTLTFSRRADFKEFEDDLKLSLITQRPTLNKDLSIKVTSKFNMDQLTYQIFGKGNLVKTATVKFNTTKEYNLIFKAQKGMAPRSKIIIYYISTDGIIISSTLEVAFEKDLPNFVNLKLSTNTSKPGENVTLSVNAHPNSYVGLLGIDQSVLLLKRGNDIEPETIFNDLNKFEQFTEYVDSNWFLYGLYHEDYRKVGAVVLTNANQTYDVVDYRVSEDSTVPLSINSNKAPKTENIKIRKNFPETWIFDNLELDSRAIKDITKTVPDTITSWIITGFSIDSENGLGLTKQSTKLNVFLPFFVTTNLPYSVKRGEIVSIPIVVYNYLETNQTAVVTLFNNNQEFEFVEADETDKRSKRELQTENKKEVVIKSNDGASIPFIIRPLKAGSITIKVTAVTEMASDGVERQLKVEPEGVTQYFNEAVLVGLVKGKEFKKEIAIQIPQEVVPDSTRIEVSVVGDIMGTTIENLDNLIKLPTGCGEQNMLKFVPNILVLDYLTSINKLSPKISQTAKNYIESGYQNELKYKHDDGSYSAFGKSDKSGSTWLTAFVAKTYNKALKYVHIDENEIYEALNFLKSIQADDGSFPEVGQVFQQNMQGGSSKGVALTAYTLSTFFEVKQYSNKFRGNIKKALDYIVKNLNQIEDTYSLAIVSYVLQSAQHPVKDEILEKMKRRSINTKGLRYWKKEDKSHDVFDIQEFLKPNSINIEMSSYAMLAFLEGNQTKEAIPIMKWLITQRNENGGFQSTQDTVVGLQALAEFARKIYSSNTDIKISVKPENSDPVSFHLDSQNPLIQQTHQLPLDARHFEITAVGVGFSVLQISYRYNLIEAEKQPRFSLKPKVSSKSSKSFLILKVCTKFIPEPKVERSNMAIMEVNLPSGFAFDNDHTNVILKSEKVKKVETKDGETVMMVYFDDIDSNEVCPEFKAFKIHSVAKQKPASVVIYDYYDNSRQARAFYSSPEVSFCDICEDDEDCLDACEYLVEYPN